MSFHPNEKLQGGRNLIATERFNHYLAMKDIKSTIKLPRPRSSNSRRSATPNGAPSNKYQRYQWHEHMRNLISLSTKLQDINSSTSMKRTTMGWVEHPSLFFRPVAKPIRKQCSRKASQNGIRKVVALPPRLSKKELEGLLPLLNSFEPADFKRYADALVQIVMRFGIDSPERLHQLHTIVIETIPPSYPSNFEEVLQRMLQEIHRNLFSLS